MKFFFASLKKNPTALISLCVIIFFYIIMIFAEFFAPYSPATSFPQESFHPANLELTLQGPKIREYRVLDRTTWNYAKVKGSFSDAGFFVKGESYKLFGIISCDRHFFGAKNSSVPFFLFGADNLGRDLFSRIVYGSRISLTIGFVASAISLLLAIIFGGLAGFYGGAVDWGVMRLSEFFMLIPSLYLILFLRSLLNSSMDSGTSYAIITIILSLVSWPGSARTLRGMVHAIKREDFVQDAILSGMPSLVVIFKHIIPQTAALLIVSTALSVPGLIMSETTLSYLGLGISDPAVSWGSLINRDISTLNNLRNFPWLLIPVFLLLAVTLAFNFLGDALRDFFDPYHTIFKKRFLFFPILEFLKNKFSKTTGKKSNENFLKKISQKSNFKTEENPNEKSKPFLSVENLKVSFQVFRASNFSLVQAVRGVSFSMERGQILGIVGESGSGKSVSVLCIPALHGQNAKISGKIFFDGIELTSLSKKEISKFRGKKIGCIFQEPARSFDPLQNIGSVFYETFKNADPKISREESDQKAQELLLETGLQDAKSRLKNFPHQFSGGQLQRISIALALAQGCELLIADEPTTALDVTIQAQIIELLLRLKKTRSLSIIFISHNIDLVAKISEKIVVMYAGLVMEQGDAEQILNAPIHPYTCALLESQPHFGESYKTKTLRAIPGKVCSAENPEIGCPFAPRCSLAKNECYQKGFSCV